MKKYRYGTDVSINNDLTLNGKIESDSVVHKISPESDNILKEQNGLYVEKQNDQEIKISKSENNGLVDNNGLYVKKPDSTINVDPSDDNTLVIKGDGLFSKKVALVRNSDNNGISNTGDGLYMKPIEDYLVIKESSTNGLVDNNGLYIKKPTGDVQISVAQDNIITMEDDGVFASETKLIISPDSKNTITESSTGLFADKPVQPEYKKISSASGNILVDNNGLYVPKIEKIEISAESGNIIKNQNGLYAKSEGSVKISESAGNAIVTNSDGLYLKKYDYISSRTDNILTDNDGLYVMDGDSSGSLNPFISFTDDGYVKEVSIDSFAHNVISGAALNEIMFLLTETDIIEYNTKTDTIKNTSNIDASKMLSGDKYSCALQGQNVVFIPQKGNNIIVYNIVSHSILKYVDIPRHDGYVDGDIGYMSAVVGDTGIIYCMPYDASNIMEISPTQELSFIDMSNINENSKGKFSDTIISNGRYVVGVPHKSNFIVRYHVDNKTAGKVGAEFTGNTEKWGAGTIIRNSELVFYPGGKQSIININNDQTSWKVVESFPNINFNTKIAINGLDANIYIISTDNKLIRANTQNRFSVIKSDLPEVEVFLNSYDGKIYGFGNKTMIQFKSAQYGINTWALSPYVNKN